MQPQFTVVRLTSEEVSRCHMEARNVFLQSHWALIYPSCLRAVINFFAHPASGTFSVLTVVLLHTACFSGDHTWSLSSWLLIVSTVAALVTVSIFLVVRKSFLDHLALTDICALMHAPAIVAADCRSALFVARNLKSLELVGTLFVFTGERAASMCNAIIPPLEIETEAIIRNVGAVPSFHGSGVGTALLRAAIDYAKVVGLKNIYLATTSAMPAAIRMYERHGFRRIRTIVNNQYLGYETYCYVLEL